MKVPLILDSFALLTLFKKEKGWEKIRDFLKALQSKREKALFSRINWGEFYYITRRRVGKFKAEEALLLLEQLPIKIIPVDDDAVKAAAEIKAEYPVSYADAFCIALAQDVQGSILTGDPEFKVVESFVSIDWL